VDEECPLVEVHIAKAEAAEFLFAQAEPDEQQERDLVAKRGLCGDERVQVIP